MPTYRGHSIRGLWAEPDLPGLGPTRVIGSVQDIPFDRPNARPSQEAEAARWMREQARAFVLDQFLRITAYDRSQPYPLLGHPSLPPFLELFSWCPARGVIPAGIRFSGRIFRRRDGTYGRFPEDSTRSLPSLGTFGEHYRWAWLEAEPFQRDFTLRLAVPRDPALRFPLRRPLDLLLVPEMVVDEEKGEEGVASFGFGLIFLGGRIQAWDFPSPALTLLILLIDERGRIVARTVLLSRQPDYPIRLPGFDPVHRTIWLPDLLGARSRPADPSRWLLDRAFLLTRTFYLYHLILQTLPVWNWIPDWRDVSLEQLKHCLDACQPPKLPHACSPFERTL
ncbi:MAG: hypothetical protein MI919_38340 [Holophagales bacterium]|nr:hypothetical protein [Holophagales bacterium]